MTDQAVSVAAKAALPPRRRDPVTLFVRWIVLAMAIVGGVGVVAMMAVTCADVLLRALGSLVLYLPQKFQSLTGVCRPLQGFLHPITGAFDIVRAAATLAIAGALPYTTAVKGHVSIDFLYMKFAGVGRVVIRILVAVLTIPLLSMLAWTCLDLGFDYRQTGEVTPTLQMPVFWMPWVIAASCAVTAIVLLHELIMPRREVVKP